VNCDQVNWGVGPWEDEDVKQQKWKLFQLFQPENQMRMRRAQENAQEEELFERPKLEKKEDEELYQLSEQQTGDLMEYVACQEEKFRPRISSSLDSSSCRSKPGNNSNFAIHRTGRQ
jgi:hypothetical protein